MNEDNKDKKRRLLLWILRIFFIVVAAVALIMLLLHRLPPAGQEIVEPISTPSSAPEIELVDNPIDFAALKAENEDIVGWIKIPGTVVNYAVFQSAPEEEEDFYLHHNTQKKYFFAGSIYMQKFNSGDFTDPNTVLYGHSMANGSMFAALHKFRKEAFFEENRYVYVYTPGHILTYEIYSAFVYDDRHILNSFDFHSEAGYEDYLSLTRNPTSMIRRVRPDVDVTTADRIITLSTCTTKEHERYLVEGVLISDQLTR